MSKKKYRCVPLELMRKVEGEYPEAWDQMAYFHSLRGSDPDMQWPEWCYAPMAAASAIVTDAMIPDFSEKAFFDISSIFALAPWRLTRQVYAMDADLERELIDSEPATKIPAEILHRLPYQSFYVQTADISVFGHKIDGFFVTLEYDVKNGEHELRLLPVSADLSFILPLSLHINCETIGEAFDRYEDVTNQRSLEFLGVEYKNLINTPIKKMGVDVTRQSAKTAIQELLPIVVYICSTDNDIRERKPAKPKPSVDAAAKPQPTQKTEPTAKKINFWDVGVRIGPALKKYHEHQVTRGSTHEGSHTPKRPHIRRAHYHSFWTGHRNDEANRELVVKWIPPIFVNADDGSNAPVTIHKVK